MRSFSISSGKENIQLLIWRKFYKISIIGLLVSWLVGQVSLIPSSGLLRCFSKGLYIVEKDQLARFAGHNIITHNLINIDESKSKNDSENEINLNSIQNIMKYRNKLGPYLAGLIEGDGTIAVHNENDKLKSRYSPKIIIVFNIKDAKLAYYLCNLLKIGIVVDKSKKGNYVLWNITKIEDAYKLILLVNGYFRTPKYEALNRAIMWLNNYIEINKSKVYDLKNPLSLLNKKKIDSILTNINTLSILDLDNSDIGSNGWLSGFSDADGNFSINFSPLSKKLKPRIDLNYRLEIKQVYTNNKNNMDYYYCFSKISELFDTGIYSRTRNLKLKNQKELKNYSSYIISVSSKDKLLKVKEYFNKYPLLSSKYLDYKDWELLLDNLVKYKLGSHPEYIKLGIELKKDHNSTRSSLTWNHLLNNYYIM